MKSQIALSVLTLLIFSCCSQTRKMQSYNMYKKEINKDVFHEFEKLLPTNYEESIMAQIRYAPSFNALGCSGIDVLFDLSSLNFNKNAQKLREANIVPLSIFKDTLNYSHTEYASFVYNNMKIALPRVTDDFCHENDTCFKWDDLETIVLETGTKKVFSLKNIENEYQPKNPNYNYTIGAFISTQKQHIVYWLFIYD